MFRLYTNKKSQIHENRYIESEITCLTFEYLNILWNWQLEVEQTYAEVTSNLYVVASTYTCKVEKTTTSMLREKFRQTNSYYTLE